MIRVFVSVFTIAILYLIYGFMVSTYEVNNGKGNIHPSHPYPFFDYRGATNVMTKRSLGSGEDREVIDSAKAAGLDFIFLTDYNLLDTKSVSESYSGDLLVLLGAKYSYLDSRLLYYQLDKLLESNSLGEIQVHLTDILSQPRQSRGETFLVLAHPFLKGYSWTGEWPIGLDGVEIINFKRVQQKHFLESKFSSFWSLLLFPFNPELAFVRLFTEPEEELQLWTTLNQRRPVVGHLGIEATAKAIPFAGSVLKFPSYETQFRLGSEHILLRSELTGNVLSDKIKILRALRKGEFYFSLDVLGDPKGFNVIVEDKDQLFLMGNEVPFKTKLKFRIEMPELKHGTEIQIVRDGEPIDTVPGGTTEIPITKPGVYRFVVRLKVELPLPDKTRWIPWIYTNHFYIK